MRPQFEKTILLRCPTQYSWATEGSRRLIVMSTLSTGYHTGFLHNGESECNRFFLENGDEECNRRATRQRKHLDEISVCVCARHIFTFLGKNRL